MSKMYAVITAHFSKHVDYKYDEVKTSLQIGLPYIVDDYAEAKRLAEEKRKVHITAFVKEFPFNPKDGEIEDLKQKLEEYDNYIQWLASVFVPKDRWDEVYDDMTKMGIDYIGADDV